MIHDSLISKIDRTSGGVIQQNNFGRRYIESLSACGFCWVEFQTTVAGKKGHVRYNRQVEF